MAFIAASSPLPSEYIRMSPRMFFSYEPESNSFQQGYLGANGSTIAGTLHVRFPFAIEAKNISLTFIGREAVETDIIAGHTEKILVNKSIYLWKTSSAIGHEPITDLDLHFEFEIPHAALESLTLNNGGVQYTLKAVIATVPKKKSASVEVIVPIRRWVIPDEQDLEPLLLKSRAHTRKVPLSWQAVLPQTFVDINSKLPIKLRLISHNPELRIHKITSFLKTQVSYTGKHKRSLGESKCYQKGKVYEKDIMMIPTGSDTVFETDVMVDIPNDVLPTCKTKYITISNQIQIKIIFEKSRHLVMIKKDVIVGRNWFNDKSAAATPTEVSFRLPQ